jgi:hypothetical protein
MTLWADFPGKDFRVQLSNDFKVVNVGADKTDKHPVMTLNFIPQSS